MGKRPTRKVVLFLVEGDSERNALQDRVAELYDSIDETIEVFFPELFQDDKQDPYVRIETGGDITQSYDVYPGNYDDQVYEFFLKDFFDIEHLLPKDVTEIIQILDLDGAYIPDSCIVTGDNPTGASSPYYDENQIICQRPESIKNRHKRKRLNVDYIKGKRTIKIKQKTVKFSAYYFSCNLDHFLHNNCNMPSHTKTIAAGAFSDGFIGDPEGFAEYFLNDENAVQDLSYEESWEYITRPESLESLQRCTNFNLLIKKLQEQR